MSLNDRQRRFVDAMLTEPDQRAAAIAAGYAPDSAEVTASRLLRIAKVAAALDEARSKRSERVQVTQDDVLRGLLTEATREEEGASHSARVSAWGLIAKHLGMLRERVELSGGVNVTKEHRDAVFRAALGGVHGARDPGA